LFTRKIEQVRPKKTIKLILIDTNALIVFADGEGLDLMSNCCALGLTYCGVTVCLLDLCKENIENFSIGSLKETFDLIVLGTVNYFSTKK